MIIKKIFLCVLFLTCTKLTYSQIQGVRDSISFYDADSVLLGKYYEIDGKINSTVYWDSTKNKINVTFKVPEYKISFDSLNNYLLEQFRILVNYEEVNGDALVYILLDGDKIKEIRIGKRIGYNNKYDTAIKETLMKAQGNWFMSNKTCKPVLFVYLFKMK